MINLKHISQCSSVQGTFNKEGVLPFYTDSRKYHHPGAFVAIPGVKVNPLDIIDNLLNEGCPLVVFQNDSENEMKVQSLQNKYPSTAFVKVSDSVTFLQELTRLHILEWKAKNIQNTVFAISGSNGKTTHKEMLSHILKEVMPGKIVATEKNNNNHLGVPLTLLNVTDTTETVVLELGSNHPGEIKVLCDIALPNAGLTTNIGATHLEFFGTEEKVFEEEGYLYHAVKNLTNEKGFFLINLDDPFLRELAPFPGAVTYGESTNAQAKIRYLDNGAEITFKEEKFIAENPSITGKHNKLNLVTCLFIASTLYPGLKTKFAQACKSFRPTKNRSEWIEFDSASVYLDAYNANPSSMMAALEGFKESVTKEGRKLEETCIVLGDMNELGDSTPQYHKEVGELVKRMGFPNVYFIGRFAHHYLEGNPQGHIKSSSSEFKNEYRNECVKKYPFHFIKGSRSLQLESLFDIT
jgi:UDP-N-acetylmuramoyl-tripeptide--D-alanyl-D-alanine ligase